MAAKNEKTCDECTSMAHAHKVIFLTISKLLRNMQEFWVKNSGEPIISVKQYLAVLGLFCL